MLISTISESVIKSGNRVKTAINATKTHGTSGDDAAVYAKKSNSNITDI